MRKAGDVCFAEVSRDSDGMPCILWPLYLYLIVSILYC